MSDFCVNFPVNSPFITQTWLADAVVKQDENPNLVQSYFGSPLVTFRQCADGTAGQHYDLTTTPKCHYFWQVPKTEFATYKGSVADWFRREMTCNPTPLEITCWRCKEGKNLCNGNAFLVETWLSIPVMLSIEAGINVSADNTTQEDFTEWDFPSTLLPDTNSAATEDGVIYDIVGRAFTNGSHFIARYANSKNSHIFNYDGRKFHGFSQRDKNAKLASDLCGSNIPLPPGYHTIAVVYHLRGGMKAQQ
jgi:hypothetical protein